MSNDRQNKKFLRILGPICSGPKSLLHAIQTNYQQPMQLNTWCRTVLTENRRLSWFLCKWKCQQISRHYICLLSRVTTVKVYGPRLQPFYNLIHCEARGAFFMAWHLITISLSCPHSCRPHNYSGLVDYSRGPLDYKALMTFALASERECDVMTIVIVVLVARYSRTLHITLMSHFIFTIWSFGIGGERGIEWCPINCSSTAVSVDGHQRRSQMYRN